MSNNHPRTGSTQRSLTAPWLHLPAAVATAVLFACQPLSAQSAPHPAPAQPSPAAKTSSRHPAKPAPAQAAGPEAQPAPAQPETPQWPVNETPGKPAITWDSQGLKINAANSSLHQILNDVSTATGAKVEGFGADERVFGEYGPGQARDIISQLLHGSGYNVLLIGDQGAGTPRQIVLSTRKAASGQGQQAFNRPTQEAPDEDVPDQPEVEEPLQIQQPPLINGRPQGVPPPQGPPGAPRTPQQVLQELQQRQQQMQDQQQQMQDQQQQPH
jgi:hypothetical protein